MIQRVLAFALANKSVILVTFEVFWIVVFLLDKLSGAGGDGVPQFVYVNF